MENLLFDNRILNCSQNDNAVNENAVNEKKNLNCIRPSVKRDKNKDRILNVKT